MTSFYAIAEKPPIITSFYTPNGNFPALAARLGESCKALELPHLIHPLGDAGDWLKSNNLKPKVILSAVLKFRQPVLYVDADCEIIRIPRIPEGTDFAILNWKADKELSERFGYDPDHLISSGGVIYFAYTAPSIELLVRWCDAMETDPQGVDDQILNVVYEINKIPMRSWWMPKTYNWMVGLFNEPPPDCVIRHDFCNRQHRN